MRKPSLYRAIQLDGTKGCGGYHPDYCFVWKSATETIRGLVCSGCREIILINGGEELYCDLTYRTGDELWKLLKELDALNAGQAR